MKDKPTTRGNGSSTPKTTTTTETPEFAIQRIYLKGVTFDAPHSPTVFTEEWKPQLDTKIQATHTELSDGNYEVTLTVTVNGKSNDNSVFAIEIKQAGIFKALRFTTDQLNAILSGMCPNILFPYARETISDLASRGTFPLLYLAPINFEAVYAQSLKQQNEQAATETNN